MSGYPPIVMSSNGNSKPTVISIYTDALWPVAPAYSLGMILNLSDDWSGFATVQVSADPAPSDGGWWNNDDTLVNITTSQNGNVLYPLTGIRLSISDYISGTATLMISQWP
jgi:hypothetical protein